jgi:hypothetical protein
MVDVDHQESERTVEPKRSLELLGENRVEMAHVGEPRLRLDPRRLDEARDGEGAVRERERQKSQGDESLVHFPERSRERAERHEAGVDEDQSTRIVSATRTPRARRNIAASTA